jgi:hypothetical protein
MFIHPDKYWFIVLLVINQPTIVILAMLTLAIHPSYTPLVELQSFKTD